MSGQDTDQPIDTNMEQEEDQKQEPEDSFFVPLDVLVMVKTSQNQNGLRSNDYYRYYKYCSRKIHRLRKAAKLTQGRRKFVKNEVTAEKVRENERGVQIPLFTAERDWANAMFLKQQLTENGDECSRNKHTARKKMRRAYQQAQIFYGIIKELWDPQTTLEAEAYLDSIKASLDVECSNYKEALDAFLRTNVIYKHISRSKDALKAAIYSEKLEQIEPLIRLCTYNISKETDEDLSNLEELEKKLDAEEKLSQKVEESLSGGRRDNNEELINITYQGKSIPLKTQKLKSSFAKLESGQAELEKVRNSDDLSLKDKVDSYTHLLHIIEGCIVVIQKEKGEEIKKSEASGTLYNLLLGYVNSIKNNSILERCLLKAFANAENIPLAQVFTKQKLKAAQRPQLVMKLFDKALRALKKISQENDALSPDKLNEYQHREMIIQVYLKFYISVHYANEKRYRHSFLVIKRTREEAQRCFEYAQSDATKQEIEELKIFNENQIEYVLCKTQAVMMLEQQKEVDELGEDLGNLELADKQKQYTDNILNIAEWLFDDNGNLKDISAAKSIKTELIDGNMNILNTGGKNVLFLEDYDENNIDELLRKKIKINKKSKIIDLSSKLQPVMPKPFLFDIAGDGIEYPEISSTIKEIESKASQGSSLLGRIKGAFFG
ncbi:unnamed protein product [Moneuplotes crassus]|uniref:Signal recognition particle subunit SRP68 n=1 Tax=Euplotes crassus TaxID=5936 RepID=A0AAD1U4E9_EUPCR|nr:unnamed protein product [Moneuplotes crassus]